MIIDAHIHVLKRDGFVGEMLKAMDDAGVAWANLVGLAGLGFMESETAGNKEVLAAVRAHPDRFTGFAYLDPREPGCAGSVAGLAEQGFRGFKLFPPVGYRVDEAKLRGVFERIAQTGLPVLVHCGQTNLDYAAQPHAQAINSALARPMFIDPLTRLYPTTTFIIAHMGFPYFMEAWSVAMANGNVLLDVAGGRSWPWPWVDVYNRLGRPIDIDWKRVWWGTDNCMPPKEGISFARDRLAEAGCTDDEIKSVMGGCAKRVLGIR